MIHALTIDFEDWYQVPLAGVTPERWPDCEPTLERSTPLILEFLSAAQIKATFFVTGYAADRHPLLVLDILNAGHEIESHGYLHQLAYLQSESELREDIGKSSETIERISGRRPIGYRAPMWSTSRIADLSVKILLDLGYVYDSSFFPTFGYYFDGRQFRDDVYYYKDSNLLEIAPSVAKVGLLGAKVRVPATGGFYLRLLPARVSSWLIGQVTNRPAVIYFHPWECIADFPRMPLAPHNAFIQYYNCGTMLGKLQQIVAALPAGSSLGSMQQAFPQIEHEIAKRLVTVQVSRTLR